MFFQLRHQLSSSHQCCLLLDLRLGLPHFCSEPPHPKVQVLKFPEMKTYISYLDLKDSDIVSAAPAPSLVVPWKSGKSTPDHRGRFQICTSEA